MRQVFAHEPVMVDEVVALFAPVGAGLVVDATVGGAGHATALLDAHPHLRVLGIDRDPDAVAAATERLRGYGDRAAVVGARFDEIERVVAGAGAEPGSVRGVLFDLGVSSPQLDRGERGFSYRAEGALDMRMDPRSTARSAYDLVNEMAADDLARLFAANGEGRFARRIAGAIVANRPVTTTTQLAEVVRNAIPAATRRTGGHPARRVFQALRIAVNEELDVLARALPAAIDLLAPGGRCVVIAYHSGEDRIVKATFAAAVSGGCVCPPGLPCVCGATPTGRLVFRGARRPTTNEIERNRRSESARLRALERLADADGTR
jgi:16S rRNA (cytosine1402-N4)-methyltransferase